MANGAILLGDVAARTPRLAVGCNRCSRRGSYSVARLVAAHGPEKEVGDLLAELAGACRPESPDPFARCGAHFPELAVLFKSSHAAASSNG